jgi:hypothetical protein
MNLPSIIDVGGVEVELIPVPEEYLLEHFDSNWAGYDTALGRVYYHESMVGDRVVNDVCHELAHAIEEIVFVNQWDFSEVTIQALGNAIHQIVRAFVSVNNGG